MAKVIAKKDFTEAHGSMGIEVKSEVTSFEARHSPGWRVNPLALDTKSPVLCIWWEDFSTLLMTLDTP